MTQPPLMLGHSALAGSIRQAARVIEGRPA
jgi:hypothetical protein